MIMNILFHKILPLVYPRKLGLICFSFKVNPQIQLQACSQSLQQKSKVLFSNFKLKQYYSFSKWFECFSKVGVHFPYVMLWISLRGQSWQLSSIFYGFFAHFKTAWVTRTKRYSPPSLLKFLLLKKLPYSQNFRAYIFKYLYFMDESRIVSLRE